MIIVAASLVAAASNSAATTSNRGNARRFMAAATEGGAVLSGAWAFNHTRPGWARRVLRMRDNLPGRGGVVSATFTPGSSDSRRESFRRRRLLGVFLAVQEHDAHSFGGLGLKAFVQIPRGRRGRLSRWRWSGRAGGRGLGVECRTNGALHELGAVHLGRGQGTQILGEFLAAQAEGFLGGFAPDEFHGQTGRGDGGLAAEALKARLVDDLAAVLFLELHPDAQHVPAFCIADRADAVGFGQF